MEYLMTYGWAILIVIIVAAALFALGVFNPATFTGQRATGFVNLGTPSPGQWQLSSTGDFSLTLKNGLSSQINITDIGVTLGSVTSAADLNGTAGCHATEDFCIVGPGSTLAFNPMTLVPALSAQAAGSSYSISVQVTYTPAGGYQQSDVGTLTGTVV